MTFRFVDGVEGVFLQIRDLPSCIRSRYFVFKQELSLFCRECYPSLYARLKTIVFNTSETCAAVLLTGVPGIGKSMFSIYCFIRLLVDGEFPTKEVYFEYAHGQYHKVTLQRTPTITADPGGGEPWTTVELKVATCREADHNALIFSDISRKTEPQAAGHWLFIFASPDPERYQTTMKQCRVHYRLTMPTWSEQELSAVGGESNWYELFVLFGGVPRFVLWDGEGEDPRTLLDTVIAAKGPRIMEYFTNHGHGDTDRSRSYMLIHINPPWSSSCNEWEYDKMAEYSFASDEVFQRLQSKFESSLIDNVRTAFNTGSGPDMFRGGLAGHMFEKIVLWLTPIAQKTVELTSLSDSPQPKLTVTFPSAKELPQKWKADKGSLNGGSLETGCLYRPKISNLESGDAFCVLADEGGGFTLIVLQVTVGATHSIKVNGLKNIVRAYPLTVQRALVKKLLVFVIPLGGALEGQQPLHTQDGTVARLVPTEAQGFQQYVVQYSV